MRLIAHVTKLDNPDEDEKQRVIFLWVVIESCDVKEGDVVVSDEHGCGEEGRAVLDPLVTDFKSSPLNASADQ